MGDQEVERKWRVGEVPADVLAARAEPIEQGYLATPEDGGEVRLRRRGERRFITVKTGRGLVRRELEIELSAEQFEALWPGTEGRRLQKTRRVVQLAGQPGDLSLELDEYGGTLSGLWIAEVEFPDEESAGSFREPSWFAEEVTERDEYKNRSLAVRGRPAAAG